MNSKLIKLLVYACIGLSSIIAAEWLYASYTQHRLLTAQSPLAQQNAKIDELPEIKLTEQAEESYLDLVARPLFIQGRKPVDEPRPEAEQAAAGKSESFDWQLSGVYGTQKSVSALFSRAKSGVGKDNNRKITVGEELDGWKLTELTRDRAVLKQGANEKELLLRKPKPKTLSQGMNGVTPAVPVPVPAPVPATIPEPVPGTTDETTEQTPENNQ